jgi:hypothetical protein
MCRRYPGVCHRYPAKVIDSKVALPNSLPPAVFESNLINHRTNIDPMESIFGWGESFLLWIKIEQALMVYANSMKLNLQDFAEAGAGSARR